MAETPWGELPVSDAHVHFFSHPFFSALARQKNLPDPDALGPLLSWEIPPADPQVLAARWVTELDANGVQKACLIASTHADEASVGAAVTAFPDRLYGFFMLDPTHPEARDRVLAAAKNPSFHCVCLFPAMHTYAITDPRLVPLLEIISDHNLAVFVHCGALSVGVRKKLNLPSQYDMRFSDPLHLHPVALHFPQVRFILPHFGAGLLREALMLADLCPNVYFDTSSSNRWMLYEGLDLRTVFHRTFEVLGYDRVLFGTDSSFFPRGWHRAIFQQQTTALYELGLDGPQAEKILHSNLVNLFEPRRLYVERQR